VAAEKNSTLVLPFPVEMLRYFDAIATGTTTAARVDQSARTEPTEGPVVEEDEAP
jgi:hypothetical protein